MDRKREGEGERERACLCVYMTNKVLDRQFLPLRMKFIRTKFIIMIIIFPDNFIIFIIMFLFFLT